MSDVHLPDPEKDAILLHHVCEVIAYDTTEYFRLRPDSRKLWGHIINPQLDSNLFWGYPLEWREYDSAGNRIFYDKNTAMMLRCGYGIFPHYAYDSFGLVRYNWKYDPNSRQDTFTYFLIPDERKFGKVHWTSTEPLRDADTTIFQLNEEGHPLLAIGYERYWADTGWRYLSRDTGWYRYDGPLLTEIESHIVSPNYTHENAIVTSRYYYAHNHLDSFIYTKRFLNPANNKRSLYTEKTYYNKYGLPETGIIADTLHVYYRIKKCNDATIEPHSEW